MKTLRIAMFSPALVLFAACSGGSDGGSNAPAPAPQPPQVPAPPSSTIAGQWQITETITNASGVCAGEIGTTETYTIHVAQNGSALTVSAPAGVFSGTMNGNNISWTGSYPEQGGTTTITSMTVTVTGPPYMLNGSSTWTWTDGTTTCQGTTDIRGALVGPAVIESGEVTFVPVDLSQDQEYAILGAGPDADEPYLLTVLSGSETTVPVQPGLHDFGLAALPADFDGDPAGLEALRWLRDIEVVSGQGSVIALESSATARR